MQSIEARVSVLETRSEVCDDQHVKTQLRLTAMEDKHDEFQARINSSNLEVSRAVTHLTVTLEGIGDKMTEMMPMAKLAAKHEIIAATATKIAAGLVVVLSAAWAIFTYLN